MVTAVVAGFAHALEADHMAAVTTFVSRRPHPMRALGFGIRWGVGHSLALLAAGGLVILLGLRIPEGLARGLEFGVGAMLVGLGIWTLAGVRSGARNAHEHSHGESAGTAWVGAAHGLAGTAGFLALAPAALLGSRAMAGAYLLLFGLGTVVAMALYAGLAGLLFQGTAERVPTLARALRVITGIASIGIGAIWML
jgi:sulfite exporter TauE/SafE